MSIRSKSILEFFVVFVSVTSCTSFAQTQASSGAALVAPLAASAPTAVLALVPYSGVAVDPIVFAGLVTARAGSRRPTVRAGQSGRSQGAFIITVGGFRCSP